ncbi:hypothetical protein ACMD2_20154, partial [Ananas comosus]
LAGASQQSSSICSQANAVAAVGRVITAICAIGGRAAAAIRGQQKLSPLSSSSFSSLLTGLTAPAASTQACPTNILRLESPDVGGRVIADWS